MYVVGSRNSRNSRCKQREAAAAEEATTGRGSAAKGRSRRRRGRWPECECLARGCRKEWKTGRRGGECGSQVKSYTGREEGGERSGQKGQKPDKVHNTQRCKTKTLHPAPCKHERAVVCLQRHEDVQRDKANCPGAEVNQGQGEMHDIGLGWAASQKRRVVVRVWRLGTWELGVVKKTPPPILDLDRRELQALSTIARPVQRKPCPGHHQPPLLSAQARPTPAIPPPPSFSPH